MSHRLVIVAMSSATHLAHMTDLTAVFASWAEELTTAVAASA